MNKGETTEVAPAQPADSLKPVVPKKSAEQKASEDLAKKSEKKVGVFPEQALMVIADSSEGESEDFGKQPLTDENFEDFIIGDPSIERDYWKFPNKLRVNGLKGRITPLLAAQSKLIADNSSIEVACKLGYDVEKQELITGELIKGEENRVDLLFGGRLPKNSYPVMEIHTHADEQLPSQADFLRMVVGKRENEIDLRYVKSGLVVCPGSQILMLPSDQAPLFEWKEAGEFFDNAHKESDATIYGKEYQDALERYKLFWEGREYAPSPENFRRRRELGWTDVVAGRRSAEDLTEELTKEAVSSYARATKYASLLVKIEKKAESAREGVFRKGINATIIEFARDNYVHIYAARDFENFQLIV